MSFHVFFAFSTGLSKAIRVPKGTTARVRQQVAEVEAALGLKKEQYLDNPPHWTTESKRFIGIDDKVLCREVEAHNGMVRGFYRTLAGKRKGDCESLTPEVAATFWHGLELLEVEPERWTEDFYQERMEALYEAMRGRESEGISFDAAPLTAEQADSVICLFSGFLDTHDIRLAVPVGRDSLYRSDDYCWCDHCGAIHHDDVSEDDDGEVRCPACKNSIA